jgi:hypothetical protein
MTAWAWRHEANTCDAVSAIKKLHMEPGRMDIEIEQRPEVAQWIAKCFASIVAGAPNYSEMKFDLRPEHRGEYEWVTVIIQKGSGKTPHQLREEVERERDELKSRLAT